jgi:hypothetical protein
MTAQFFVCLFIKFCPFFVNIDTYLVDLSAWILHAPLKNHVADVNRLLHSFHLL